MPQFATATVNQIDPYYTDDKLLMHMDGANGSTTFTDVKGHAFTASGSAQISTTQSMFGGASFYGDAGYITTPAAPEFVIGTGDFTIEAWVYPLNAGTGYSNSGNVYQAIVAQEKLGTSTQQAMGIGIENGNLFGGLTTTGTGANATTVFSTTALPLNTWSHVALVGYGNTITLYLNGSSIGTVARSGAEVSSTLPLAIGSDSAGQGAFNGYIDEVRYTNGAARYTGNFTPAGPFPNSDNITLSLGAGQQANYAFTGTVGQLLTGTLSGVTTTPSGANASMTITNPDGSTLGTITAASSNTAALPVLTQAGTYNVVMGAGSNAVGLTAGLAAVSGGTGPANADFDFASDVLLLHMDGTNGSTSFTDVIGHSFTAIGTPEISTTQSMYGGASLYSGNGGSITTPTTSAFALGTNDYTIEAWVYPINSGTGYLAGGKYYQSIIAQNQFGTATQNSWSLYTINGNLAAQIGTAQTPSGSAVISSSVPLTLNAWSHVALVGHGSTVTVYLNGTAVGSITRSGAVSSSTLPIGIGGDSIGQGVFNGYIDEVRFTNGVARYTENFAPAGPFAGYGPLQIATNGSGTAVSLAAAQEYDYTFTGSAGNAAILSMTGVTTTPSSGSVTMTVLNPNGSVLATFSANSGSANSVTTPTLTQSGTYTVLVNAATSAATLTESVTMLASQTITFGTLSSQTFGVAPFTVSASTSSGLAVGFTSASPTVCTVSGSTVTLVGAGTCTINANQAGNTSYNAAAQVSQSFSIAQAAETISFTAPTNVAYGSGNVTLSATASSGLAVTFASSTTGVCTVSGTSVSLITAGTCTIAASQSGNANYSAAQQVTQSFTITQASQTLSFAALSNKILGQPAFTVSATASSTLTASFSSATASVCSTGGTNGSTVTLIAAGTCTIVASQAGNANYGAASSVSQSFSVTADVAPTVSITSPSAGQNFAAPASITVSANAGSSDASIAQVQFYNGTTLIGTATQSPYSITWGNVAAGSYSLTAVASDNLGGSTTSAPVSVTVLAATISTVGAWQAQSMGSASNWTPVAYGQGKFVVFPWEYGGASTPSTTSYAAYSTDNGVTWHNSWLPYNNWWNSAAYGNGVFVAVSYVGSNVVVVSPDAVNWTSYTMPVGANWNSITFGNGTFVAVADSGATAITSPDGIHWTQQTLPASAQWSSVAYGNGIFVAVAGGSNITASSPDGVTWTQNTLPASAQWSSIAYGNSTFVAIASSSSGTSYSAASPDGVNWTSGTLPTADSWHGVAYGAGIFAAVSGTGGGASSVDGINWTSKPLPTSASWTGLAYGNNTFLASASQGPNNIAATLTVTETTPPSIAIASPAAGQSFNTGASINLTVNAASSGAAIAQVQYFNGSALIGTVTQAPYSFTWSNITPGNLTLTAMATDVQGGATTSAPVSITVAPAVAVTLTGSGAATTGGYTLNLNAAVSDLVGSVTQVAFYNGATLLGTVSQAPYSLNLPNLAPGTYLITAQASDSTGVSASASAQFDLGPAQYSTASNWQAQTIANPASLTALTYGQGKFVAFPWANGGVASAGNTSGVEYSTDNGATWQNAWLPYNNWWDSAAYGNGIFVAVSYNGSNTDIVSPDGQTWVSYTMPTSANWSAITFGNGTFVALADNSTVAATSPDGINWTQQTLPTNARWISLAYGNGLFTAIAGNSNIVATSPDGVTWTQHTLPLNTGWSSIAYGNGTFVAVAFGNAVSAAYPNGVSYSAVSPDGINWTTGTLPGPASWNNVAYGAGLFVAIAGPWSPTVNSLGGANAGNYNSAATSVDGIHWISNPTPSASSWAALAYGDNTFIAVAGQGSNDPAAILTVSQSTPPTIAIASPTAGQAIAGPATVTLTANAVSTAAGAAITQVQYFSGTTLIGSATQAPYSVAWNSLAEGSYSMTAVATDSHGSVSTSAPVAFDVSLPILVAVTSPANGAQVSGKNLTISASASVSGTAITQVGFYNGSALLGTMSQPPYSITFPDLDPGSYSITAQATDSLGLTATSSAVNVTVLPDGQTAGGSGNGTQAVYDVHTDQLDTPRMVTDQGGNIVWQWDNQDPFGNNLPNQDPNGTGNQFVFNLGMSSQYWDIETATFYNYYRDYDPAVGRYLQSDPVGLAGGQVSTYSYVNGNPIGKTDPDGLQIAVGITPPPAAGSSSTPKGAWPNGSQPFWPSWSSPAASDDSSYSQTDPYFGDNDPFGAYINDPQANAEWQAYKDAYKQPPPPNLDECQKLAWQLAREQALLAGRQGWDAKWDPLGLRHAGANIQSLAAIRNIKAKMKAKGCTCP